MGRTREKIYVCDFETTVEDCEWFKNQEPQPHPFIPNAFMKTPRVSCWGIKQLRASEFQNEEQPIYFYDFIENTKANNAKEMKDIRGKRQEEAYDFDGMVFGSNEKSFIDWVLNINTNTIIYFHNLNFDGTYIIQMLKELKKYGFDQVHCEKDINNDNPWALREVGLEKSENGKVNISPCYWNVFQSGKDIYEIRLTIKNRNRKAIYITFKCSAKLLSNNVKNLGISLGENGHKLCNKPLLKFLSEEQQQDANFYKVEPMFDVSSKVFYNHNKEFVDYCFRDVEIVRRSLINFEKVMVNLPTMKKYAKVYEEENKKRSEKKDGSWGKYFTIDGEYRYDIFSTMTIASLCRKMGKDIYCKDFQQNNIEFDYLTPFRHTISDCEIQEIKKLVGKPKKEQEESNFKIPMYKSLIHMSKDDHDFVQQIYDTFDNKRTIKLYGGGITQFNKKYQLEQDTIYDFGWGVKIDVSSAYPFQMTYALPYGKIITHDEFMQESKNLTIDGKQVYINSEDGYTFKESYYSKSEKRVKKSIPIKYGGYKDLLDDKEKYTCFFSLNIEWIEPKSKEQDPTQFALTVPIFKSKEKLDSLKKDYETSTNPRYIVEREHDISAMMWEEEWNFIKKYYNFKLLNHEVNDDNIEQDLELSRNECGIKAFYVLKAPYLKTMMEELYQEKDKYSKSGDASGKLSTKIALNSMYGSLGIKDDFNTTTFIDVDFSNEILEALKEHRRDRSEFVFTLNNVKNSDLINTTLKQYNSSIDTNYKAFSFLHDNPNKENKLCYNILSASYVTMKQRLYLYTTIERIGVKYFAYSDTDSIIFGNINNDVWEDIKALMKERPHAFLNVGSWECEIARLKAFQVFKAKDYVQVYYNYDFSLDENGKEKGFYIPIKHPGYHDENGNWVRGWTEKQYVSEQEAPLQYYFVNSGYTLGSKKEHEDLIKEFKMLTLKQRMDMSDEEYESFWNRGYSKEDWDGIISHFGSKSEFFGFLRRGYLYVFGASKEPIKRRGNIYYVGGTLLGYKNKQVSYGRQ